jgi:hypothetical protein
MNNVALKNLNQHLDDGGVQQLQGLIKEFKRHDTMNVEYHLNCLAEIKATLKLLSDAQIIENLVENNKNNEIKNKSWYWSLFDVFKTTITLCEGL